MSAATGRSATAGRKAMSEEEGNYQVRESAERTAIPPFVAPTGCIPSALEPSQSSGLAGSSLGSSKRDDCGTANGRCFMVLDAGHRYELFSLDGAHQQELRFVKRFDLGRPWRFPGNFNGYSGTTLQSVIRVLIDRLLYLQNQIWSVENVAIIKLLRLSLWALEFRAARRHGRSYWHGIRFAATAPMCPECGHTVCNHAAQAGAVLGTSGPTRSATAQGCNGRLSDGRRAT
jgi:hypothetical protein